MKRIQRVVIGMGNVDSHPEAERNNSRIWMHNQQEYLYTKAILQPGPGRLIWEPTPKKRKGGKR